MKDLSKLMTVKGLQALNILERLKKADDDELFEIGRRYAEGCGDVIVEDMGDLDEALQNYTPSEIVESIKYGKFEYYDDYFYLDDLGLLYSTNDPIGPYDLTKIAEYAVEDGDELGSDDIRAFLEENNRNALFTAWILERGEKLLTINYFDRRAYQDDARELAKDFQLYGFGDAELGLSQGQLADMINMLEEVGEKFGLSDEFIDKGIC